MPLFINDHKTRLLIQKKMVNPEVQIYENPVIIIQEFDNGR